ncbi:MAG: hypothetical protein E3J90_13720 [Promethearchaeota archaeon]|nr:MAG: hypothetical protein E3J90_13720 [Candidatus Lokiarchaeota archaeon]
MYSSLAENFFFSQVIIIRKKFSNTELKFTQLFFEKTNIFPVSVILVDKFVFFFVKPEDYLTAKSYIKKLRYILINRKVLVIGAETTLIKLIFSFFDDIYIHNVQKNENPRRNIIDILFLSYKDRAVAVGKKGKYIKTVNYLFKNYISFKNPVNKSRSIPLELRCSLTYI